MTHTTHTCRLTGNQFYVTDKDKVFYEKIGVPAPTVHPVERQKQRIRFRNFRDLHTRPSSMSGKPVISMYDPTSPYQVYSRDEWWSDKWDAMNYGRDFDFNRPFFEQWKELNIAVPKIAMLQYQSENSDYCNFVYKSKNCYLVYGCVENEDCAHGHIVWQSFKCLDSLYAYRCQWSYECVDCVGCYQVFYSQECVNSNDLYFCYDCLSCNNCFGSSNLRNKQWYWFNEYVGEEEYKKRLAELMPLTIEKVGELKGKFEEIRASAIHPEMFGNNNENVTGNHVYFSRNCHYVFDAKECEDCQYVFTGQYYKDSQDISFSPGRGELMYQCLAGGSAGGCQMNLFSYDIMDCSDIAYCDNCYSCTDCFGCSGLRHKQYCILNKQYSKEEYFDLKAKIIEHMKSTSEWGEFFPHELSPFAYNRSVAQEYYPLTKEQAAELGYTWKDKVDQVSSAAGDTIVTCSVTGRKFKIITQEIEFLEKFRLPLPTKHPDQRHFERMAQRNPRVLWPRKCAKSGIDIWTSFSPERPEKVYCEKCYLEVVY